MKIRGGPSSPISSPLSYSKITAVHEYSFPEKNCSNEPSGKLL